MAAGLVLGQANGDAHGVTAFAQAAFDQITRGELASRSLQVGRLASAVGIGRAAADDDEALRAGERHDDLVREAGGQMIELGFAAEIAERPDRDRRRLDLAGRGSARFAAVRQPPDRRREAVAEAMPGDDEMRPPRVIPKLLAQAAHQRVDRAVVGVPAGLLQGLQQEVAAEGSAGGVQEGGEQAHLLARQVDGPPVGRAEPAMLGREAPAGE